MQYKPSKIELNAVAEYSDKEKLQYFLQRVIESEEIWGLGNESGWVTRISDNRNCLPVWPYQEYAADCITGEWEEQQAQEMSIEQFTTKVLPLLKENDMDVEIFPTAKMQGQVIAANVLLDYLESTIDAGEYYMEG